MKFNSNLFYNIIYVILFILLFLVIFYTYDFKRYVAKNLIKENDEIIENFEGLFDKKTSVESSEDSIFALINRKLESLEKELGGDNGKKDIKNILKKTKKVCDLECSKCMMNMINKNKNIKTIDLDSLVEDDSSSDCIKCKNYTELSNSIKNMIDSL
tara:strand:+ start:202 stop:672 length:471 start_codon:yes stop_codon:yes gene_type:complete